MFLEENDALSSAPKSGIQKEHRLNTEILDGEEALWKSLLLFDSEFHAQYRLNHRTGLAVHRLCHAMSQQGVPRCNED
jgi:hypothetical protein